ncbi:MAG: hypothetical protein ACOZNI_02995 [Myxococcota bacterium]
MNAPKEYTEAGFLMIVSGVLNAITAFIWFLSLFWICIGFFWVIPGCVGLWQAYVGYQMQVGTPQGSAKMGAIAGLVSGVFNMNPIAIVCALLAMTKVGKPEVVGYLGGGQ